MLPTRSRRRTRTVKRATKLLTKATPTAAAVAFARRRWRAGGVSRLLVAATAAFPVALVLAGVLGWRRVRRSDRIEAELDVDGPNQSAPGHEIPESPATPDGAGERPEVAGQA